MPETKVVVCLANSWKHHDRCVAGIEWVNGDPRDWIRPVTTRDGHGVSFNERRLPDGGEPKPLDIIQIPLVIARPTGYQTENWLLDPTRSWSKVGELPWIDLENLEDAPADLWGSISLAPETAAMSVTNSLALVRIRAPILHVLDGGFQQVRRELRVIFKYRRATYNLKVTDPDYVNYYLSRNDGRYRLSDCYLTVSLTEPFQGFCYKVIAAVLESGGPPEGNR